MKKIGMLGGMSWESTAKYYEYLNVGIREKFGGLHSAKIAMVSLDFEEIDSLQRDGDWISASEILTKAALDLQNTGSDFILICTNTMHKIYDKIQANLSIPVLHIIDSTGKALAAAGYKKVGLLGTKFTMEEDFYKRRLLENFSIETLVPSLARRDEAHRIIYEELCCGRLLAESRQTYLQIIKNLKDSGAEAIILGCTEIPLLISQNDTEVPVFDTTTLHAAHAVELATDE